MHTISLRKPVILGGDRIIKKSIPYMRPLLPQFKDCQEDLKNIFTNGTITKGHYLEQFEEHVADYLGVKYAVGLSSCTTGLTLALQALGLTGEVIVPSFTFMASAHAIRWNHLTPIFVDVDPKTWNIDPTKIESKINSRTSTIVAVHVFGNPSNVIELEAIARAHHLKLIFDAAHGFGALYRGSPLGKFGDAEVFSCSPTKLLVTGEGGVLTTNDQRLAERIKVAREYGNPGNYDSLVSGANGRMQEFSAILGLKSLARLEENARARNARANFYRERLNQIPGIAFQAIHPHNRSSYKDFTISIRAEEFGLHRDHLVTALRHEGIDCRTYYSPPVHRQTAYQEFSNGVQLPVTDHLSESCLSLPLYAGMSLAMIEVICQAIMRIRNHAPAITRRLAGAIEHERDSILTERRRAYAI